MYTIIVNQDNTLDKTVVERIMCKSKLVNHLHFLVPLMYGEIDMNGFTAVLEYRLPASGAYHSEILVVQPEIYKEDYLEYRLPFDTNLTSEAGEIELQLTFTKAVINDDGTSTQYVRKTLPTTITITPIATWSDLIPDAALTALDQRIIALNLAQEQLAQLAAMLNTGKADNIVIDGDQLQLTSNGERIGDAVTVNQTYNITTSGELKVVEI